MNAYEVICAGYRENETTERMLWVQATSEQQVIEAIAYTGARPGEQLPDNCLDFCDFKLPEHSEQLASRCLYFTSLDRAERRGLHHA